jgi:hypothetical protein
VAKQQLPKTLQEIEKDWIQMLHMECKPVGMRKLPENYISNEDMSVKWNRERVVACNETYLNEVARLNTKRNHRRDEILNDIYKRIQFEVGHDLSIEKAKIIWNHVHRDRTDYDIHELFYDRLFAAIDLAADLLEDDDDG